MKEAKPFVISKQLVMEAFKRVKANAGAAGVDGKSIEEFERNLKGNLYKIWNRMSSGSYFPPPVRAMAIPKKSGGERILGMPTVSDRVAQMVVRLCLEPKIEPEFLTDSFGYRPNKSALDAIGVTRQRCWKFDWVLEFDIVGLFDNIPHDLLLKALRRHTDCSWTILYIERWLKSPMLMADGTSKPRDRGTPQGGVISPLLANLFLHYAFDVWMKRNHPDQRWCRYADDGLVHCETQSQAEQMIGKLEARLRECGLELHPKKTKIVYCKDANRKDSYPNTSFDFLGYTFRTRTQLNQRGKLFAGFSPGVSRSALKSMRKEIRRFRIRSDLKIEDIANLYNPKLRGWIAYYGKYFPSAMSPMYRHFNVTLVDWLMRKHKSLRGHKTRAGKFAEQITKQQPKLFYHWAIKKTGVFV